ncbi:MAG TPA: AmmeMemoRadiSam system radical SAM enzyme [Candidatus Tectomicrobia bacterium]|nr:AmmeMemoRadiSam system radical SAM enzyme [Candidatus Tectomicrobia bacterium]
MATQTATLAEVLGRLARPGELHERLPGDRVRCHACGHRCVIPPGQRGVCKVRWNEDGRLMVPAGYVAGLQLDPVEKKPFFHAYPGARALSFGMLGCDLHCAYCQNHVTSQALRDPLAGVPPQPVTASEIVRAALDHGARILTSTYNEPLITSEWAVEVFRAGRAHGLVGSFVSNGNATPEVLEYLRPWVDLYKVDLKGFDDRRYRTLGGVLRNVLDTIRLLHARGFWLEVVTLVVPGFNDSDGELRDIAQFLVSVSSDIPWHVTAFHADYRMVDRPGTSAATLRRAAELGRGAGLRYVYAGNLPGRVGPFEHTWCPACRALLVERSGFTVRRDRLTPTGGACPECGARIPGRWA